MPIVEVKGVGQAQFPDGMSQEQIKDALQKKFTPDYNFDIPERYSFAKPSELSMQDKVKGYLFDVLTNNNIISNPYSANKVADNLSTILSFLPGTGTAFAGDEAGRALKEGDYLTTALNTVGEVPLVGEVLGAGAAGIAKAGKERLFHASNVDFDEFDPSRVGDRLTSLGLGHYLTPNKEKASQYGSNIMEFDVDTSDILDWEAMTNEQRQKIEDRLLSIVPGSRIAHFGGTRTEILPKGKEGAKRFKELKEKTSDAYNDYAKARILSDDEIEKEIPDFDFSGDEVVVGWRESGDLSRANPEQLMTLMNEYDPNMVASLGFKGARFGDEVAIYDPSLAKRAGKSNKGLKEVTHYNDLFDFSPEQLSEHLRLISPNNVKGDTYIEQTKFGEKRFNSDGSIDVVKGGEVLRRIEPQDAEMAYKNKIMKIEGEKPEVKAAQDKRKAEFDAEMERQRSQEKETYKMQHTAPTREDNPTGENLIDAFGDDIYSARAKQYYGTGSSYDDKAISIIQEMQGNPDKEITIYRAVPKSVKEINPTDWVTTTKEYAADHMAGEKGWHILSKKVKAKDIATDGNSIHEFGYSPQNER